MEYLVRSASAAMNYFTFEHPEERDAARCAIFQMFCVECSEEIPAEGPSVTFRHPGANPGEPRTYLTTVHMGECSTKVQKRILDSLAGDCVYCGAEDGEQCNPDCLSTVD